MLVDVQFDNDKFLRLPREVTCALMGLPLSADDRLKVL